MTDATISNPKFQVLTSLSEFESYADEYRALFNASDASPYMSYEWLHAFIKYQTEKDDIYICIASDNEGPFASIPLVVKKEHMARRLELLAEGPATHNTGLILKGGYYINVLSQACAWLKANHTNWDYCLINRLPEESGLYAENEPASSLAMGLNSNVDPSMAIDLPDNWEAFLAGVSKKLRNNIRRTIRNLEADHQVNMVRVGLSPDDSTDEVEKLIEDALSVCRRSWQGKAEHGVAICDASTEEFFKQSSRALAKEGMLDLAVLYIDDTAAAYSWGAARNGIGYISTAGFDAELIKLGPGTILDALIIKDSIERSMTLLDWGSEFADYKRHWCNRSISLFEAELYASAKISKFKRRMQERWNYSIKPRIESWKSASNKNL